MGYLDIISYLLLPLDLQSFASLLFFSITAGSLYWYWSMPKNLPPGPMGIPLLGSIPFLGRQPHFTFNKMAKKYGQVFSVYLGGQLVIVLNDYEATKEALVNQSDKFWSRPPENALQLHEVRGVMPVDDDTIWKTHRTFTIKTFRDFGVGKNIIEEKIIEEVQFFLKEFDKNVQKSFNPKNSIDTSVANNICSILFGKRFDYDDRTFLDLKRAQDEIVQTVGSVTVFVFLPWTRYIPGLNILLKRQRMVELFREFKSFISNEWNNHNKSFDESNKNDYTSAFIAEQKKLEANNENDDLFKDKVFFDQARTLLAAGIETTATLLKWSIIYLINYPEKQRKAQQEIDTVIGQDRKPQWNDRLRTPYVEAFMMEVHRIVSFIPLGLPHSNVSDAVLYGYHIPKRSTIISNLWNVHHDPKHWENPDEFRPERFLNKDNEIIKPEYFIPFSIGRRACLGENLAKMEGYLYFTSLLQKFTFEAEPGNPVSMKTSSGGLVNVPPAFNAVIKHRT